MRRSAASDILLGCRSWPDVTRAAGALKDAKAQGDLFEALVCQYFRLDPVYQALFDDVWLLHDTPPEVRRTLDLGDGDIGIDLVCRTREGKYWAVQAKYRANPHQALSWKRDLSTFAGLVAGRPFEQALVATTTIDVSERSKQGLKGHFGFLKADVWSKLDEEFFRLLAARLVGRNARLEPREPRRHQRPAIRDVIRAFSKKAARAKLLMACGTGKTLTSFFIADSLGAARVLIAVPNLGLARQILREWMRESVARGRRPRTMVVCSDKRVADDEDIDIEVTDLGVHVTTDANEARDFLRSDGEYLVVTTYQSGETTASAARAAGVAFDLGIFDEAHKTVGHAGKSWTHLLFDKNIRISKRLFMTATERVFRNTPDDVELVDMDDVEHYGETAHSLTFLQALDKKLLCDYRVVTLETTSAKAERLLAARRIVLPKGFDRATRVEMLAAALELLGGMQQCGVRHVITFHSSVKRARFFEALSASLLRLPKYRNLELATFHLNGSDSAARRDDVMRQALAAKYSVVTNCRCLTEGIDVPAIDGVAFVDAKGSKVDIVQAVGRALRRSDGKRFGYVFIPAVLSKGQDLQDLKAGPYAATAATITAMGTMDEDIVAMVDVVSQGKPWMGTRSIPFTMPVGVKVDPLEFGRGLALRLHSRLAVRAWTKELLVALLRARAKAGLKLNSGAVGHEDPGLVRAGTKLFGSWDQALTAAGIDPKAIRLRQVWTKELVVAAIKKRARKGLKLNIGKVREEDVLLGVAGYKLFGSWDNAVEAAGLNPDDVRINRQTWTKESVVAAVKERARRGLPLNAGALQVDDSSLGRIGGRLFGSWDKALAAAGLNPENVRLVRRGWTKEMVVAGIKEQARNGVKLNLSAVQKAKWSLWENAKKVFGSWDEALKAAGFDPEAIRPKAWRLWTEEKIIGFLRQRARKGQKINVSAAMDASGGVVSAAIDLFGSWDKALEAAGVNPDKVRLHKRWTKERVVAGIRERKKNGLKLNMGAAQVDDSNLTMAAVRHFGSWDRALKAAGIDPQAVKLLWHRSWTKAAVIAFIQERRAKGGKLNRKAVDKDGAGPSGAASRYFGSWDNALVAAGVAPEEVRLARAWTKEKVLAAIKERKKRGLKLHYLAVTNDDESLVWIGRKTFGSWDGALRAAGIDPRKVKLGPGGRSAD